MASAVRVNFILNKIRNGVGAKALFYNKLVVIDRGRNYVDPQKWIQLEQDSTGKWITRVGNYQPRTARGLYIYVVQDGKIWLSPFKDLYGHSNLARGNPVEYAGEVFFGSGKNSTGILRWWNNNSGHYLPAADWAEQAGFDRRYFVPVSG